MACKDECVTITPSSCIDWQGDATLGCDLETIIATIGTTLKTLEAKADYKTLSNVPLDTKAGLQLLIDSMIKMQLQLTNIVKAQSTNTSNSTTNNTSNNSSSISIDSGCSGLSVSGEDMGLFVRQIYDELQILKKEIKILKLSNHV